MSKLDEYKALLMNTENIAFLSLGEKHIDKHFCDMVVGRQLTELSMIAIDAQGNIVFDIILNDEDIQAVSDELEHLMMHKAYTWENYILEYIKQTLEIDNIATTSLSLELFLGSSVPARFGLKFPSDFATIVKKMQFDAEKECAGLDERHAKARLEYLIMRRYLRLKDIASQIAHHSSQVNHLNMRFNEELQKDAGTYKEPDIPF